MKSKNATGMTNMATKTGIDPGTLNGRIVSACEYRNLIKEAYEQIWRIAVRALVIVNISSKLKVVIIRMNPILAHIDQCGVSNRLFRL